MLINTIYPSFMGECNPFGIGAPCIFVRTQGCNLKCYKEFGGCDTPDSLSFKGKEMDNSDIVDAVRGYKLVCITGGEPLCQDDLASLLGTLCRSHKVVIETNGSMDIRPYKHIKNVHFVVDYKLPSTCVEDRMFKDNFFVLDENDYIKFVIKDETDYKRFYTLTNGWRVKAKIAVGTFWGGEMSYSELFDRLQKDELTHVHVNMQTHKMAFLYDHYRWDENFNLVSIPKDV